MRNFILSFLLLFFISAIGKAQITAVTQTGDQVILSLDGTWRYASDTVADEPQKLDTIETTKPASAKFLVKSERIDCGVWIDPKVWKFKKENDDEAKEYMFNMAGEDAYAMLIPEKIQMPLESLKELAIENAKNVATNVKVVSEQVRKVNGLEVICMQINGTIRGINFTYYGYYYSSEKGSLQFVSYTSQNLFEQYKPRLEMLLNGLVETNASGK